MYIDLEDESCGTIQTKGKEYKVIFYTQEIKGEKEWYEPIRIKKYCTIKIELENKDNKLNIKFREISL